MILILHVVKALHSVRLATVSWLHYYCSINNSKLV
nr:MAG TPA: Elongation factor 2, Guanine nucleotide-binding, eukaryotic, ribosomal, 80S, RNA.0A [Caudoviricetes sp.]